MSRSNIQWTHLIIHVHEIALKGKNRGMFERCLMRNLEWALRGMPFGRPRRDFGRIILPTRLSETSLRDVMKERVRHCFGVASAALAVRVDADLAAIRDATIDLLRDSEARTFAIDTRRGNKSFPMTSTDVNRAVGAAVRQALGLSVSLDDPDVTCTIELVPGHAYLSLEQMPGPGGLPVGSSGCAVVLLSGGIDSPVAAYELMKRGVECVFAHFHGVPFTDRASIEKVRDIVDVLTTYQGPSKLFLVPFGDFQKQIVMMAPEPLRVVLYRRSMIRIAEEIAKHAGIVALATGENIGQVASQTIQNIRTIEDAAAFPILRPLLTWNKDDIIRKAKDIGVYDISIRPHQDCCTLFMPRKPATRSSVNNARGAEKALNVNELVKDAVDRIETVETLSTHNSPDPSYTKRGELTASP